MKIVERIIGLGMITLFGYSGVRVVEKDVNYLRDMNRLSWDMRNASIVEHVVQEGESYADLQREYFSVEGYDKLREWGNGSEEVNLYRSAIGLKNDWDLFSLGRLEEGMMLRVPVRR